MRALTCSIQLVTIAISLLVFERGSLAQSDPRAQRQEQLRQQREQQRQRLQVQDQRRQQRGQGAAAAQPTTEYLGEMPSPAQIYTKVHGKDQIDTLGRQSGAFRQLRGIIRALSAGGDFGNSMSGEEKQLSDLYTSAEREIEAKALALLAHSDATKSGYPTPTVLWNQTWMLYDLEAYRDELLDLFSPRLKAIYQSRFGTVAGRAAASWERANASVKAEQEIRARAEAHEEDLATWRSRAAADVAKAEKAHVDMSAFGLQLGQPLELPDCSFVSHNEAGWMGPKVVSSKTCFLSPKESRDLCKASLLSGFASCETTERRLQWGEKVLPSWAAGAVPIMKGNVMIALTISFPSYPPPTSATVFSAPLVQAGQDAAASACQADVEQAHRQLRAKYGKPTTSRLKTFRREGKVVRKDEEMTWRFPGLYVSYEAGSYQDTVTIEVASVYKAAEEKDNAETEAEPKP